MSTYRAITQLEMTEETKILTWIVPAAAGPETPNATGENDPPPTTTTPPLRADLALFQALKLPSLLEETHFSRNQLKNLMLAQKITRNGRPLKPHQLLVPGDVIRLEIPPLTSLTLIPEEGALDILFEDSDLLVINKPPGLTVHPSPTQLTGTLVHRLLYQIHDLSGIGGVARPGIVHRLDKNTSGALVISKSDRAHLKLSAAFAAHTIERKYWALCYGAPSDPETFKKPLEIRTQIGRHPSERTKMSIHPKNSRSRLAISQVQSRLHFALPQKKPFASWLEVSLQTGRTHQVRVHLQSAGHAILGDPLYGTPTTRDPKWKQLPRAIQEAIEQLPGQALHARVLGFEHPVSGKALRFEASPPAAFQNLLTLCQQFM